MDKPIPETVRELVDEWRAKARLCVDTDPGVQAAGAALECCADDLATALTAAQQQEQAAPKIAPVGVERKYPDDGNGDDDAYNRGWNDCLDTLAQQPTAVDEAMVERACKAALAEVWPDTYEEADDLRAMIRRILSAALATQHQEPTT